MKSMKKLLSAVLVWFATIFAPGAAQASPPPNTNNGPKTHQSARPGSRTKTPGPQTRRGRYLQVPRRRKHVMLAEASPQVTRATDGQGEEGAA